MFKYNAIVDKVVDGDTVDLSIDLGFDIWHRARVRINGIDTPEKWFDYGKVVKQYVADTLESKKVEIVSFKTDKYGRYLIDLYVDTIPGKTFNQHLIDEQMARGYDGGNRQGIWTEEDLAQRTHPLLLTKIDFED
jgi:micrococcal nuclease